MADNEFNLCWWSIVHYLNFYSPQPSETGDTKPWKKKEKKIWGSADGTYEQSFPLGALLFELGESAVVLWGF